MAQNDADVGSYEVISWVLVALVGIMGVAISQFFGVPLGLALLVFAALVGVVVFVKYGQHALPGGRGKASDEP